jgi:hypothetical protein
MLLWCAVYKVSLDTIISVIYGDDQSRKHSEWEHYFSFAKFVLAVGFRVSSAHDKSKETDPGDLSKFEFLKRTLVCRNGLYYAPLTKLSICKSLMYPRHKKENGQHVLLQSDFKNTVMMAMREAYIGDYDDIMQFCLKLDKVYGFDLEELPGKLHEQYVTRQFTFDYVRELSSP